MKLKKCPQCKNLISVTAPTCLYCGRPNKFVTKNYIKSKWNKEYKLNKLNNINIFKIFFSRNTLIFSLILLITLLISLYK